MTTILIVWLTGSVSINIALGWYWRRALASMGEARATNRELRNELAMSVQVMELQNQSLYEMSVQLHGQAATDAAIARAHAQGIN